MITVISGTNRKGNFTDPFSKYVYKLLKSKTKKKVQYFSLQKMPDDILNDKMYEQKGQSKELRKLQEEFMIPANKFVIISPEYNGSFPGALKLFLDACSVYQYKPTFKGKKAALVGVSSGRAGNLMGMNHLNIVLNHVGVTVMPNKLPISKCEDLLNEKKEITDAETLKTIEKYVDEFLAF